MTKPKQVVQEIDNQSIKVDTSLDFYRIAAYNQAGPPDYTLPEEQMPFELRHFIAHSKSKDTTKRFEKTFFCWLAQHRIITSASAKTTRSKPSQPNKNRTPQSILKLHLWPWVNQEILVKYPLGQ